MFYYYGRKKRIAHLYPEPRFDTIIEPFAGSAAYSLHGNRWEKQIFLYDTNPVVIDIWNYLLSANVRDIEKLPIPKEREDTRDIKWLSREERLLMGFSVNPGSRRTCYITTHFSRWKANRQYIIDNLYKIKHWKVFLKDYREIDSGEATWFIDPPYKKMGVHYVKTGLDYNELALWIKNRNGQVIACEGEENGNYLPFRPLIEFKALGKRTSKEFVFIKER